MSTITAILEPQPDGTLHVPVPEELRHTKIKLVATLEALPATDESTVSYKGFGALKGKISMSPDFDEPLEDFQEYME
jgi:hypothetical protein